MVAHIRSINVGGYRQNNRDFYENSLFLMSLNRRELL